MRRRAGAPFVLSILLWACGAVEDPPPVAQADATPGLEEITFAAADGVRVHADLHRVLAEGGRPLVLLFHQGAASARGEYGFLVPRLLDAGWDVLAVDQRRGGDRFGGVNRTAAAVDQEATSYCEAQADVAAALDFALRLPGMRGRPVLWGSSYSAALVLREASARPRDVSAVLAFSPAFGDPMDGCRPEDVVSRLQVPALVLRPASEAAIPSVGVQLDVFREAGVQTYVADPGAHGSSMLDPERVGAPVDATRAVVTAFLEDVRPG